MTLPEAIKILELDRNCAFEGDADKLEEAIQLGIEALKFRQRWEEQEGEDDFPLLPGETKEIKLKESGFTEEELKDIRHNACDDTIG